MKQLFAIDLHDYDGCTKTFCRPSARGIIIKDGSIALVYSQKEHYYKFPGGGIRPGEDKTTALVREVKEETGLTVIPDSIAAFGSVLRRQRSDMAPDTVFEQENFYYVCRVEDTIAEQNLDDYEREAEFILRFTDIDEAIRVNEAFHSEDFSDEIMIKRELRVLRLIREAVVAQTLLPYAYGMHLFSKAGIYENEYAFALDNLLEASPENRYLNEMAYISGAEESAGAVFAQNEYPIISPDDFGKELTRLLRPVYETSDTAGFAAKMFALWETLPEGIRHDEPFIRLSYADDPLSSCGEEERTREILESFFNYYQKDIPDEWETIGCCGVDCAVCPDYTGGKCLSCRGTAWTDDDICMPVKCCRERGIAVCGQCGDFPCAAMAAFYEESDSHRQAGERMRRMRQK